eukprot:3293-Heterococcus_DN1.PRE.1
MTVSCSSFKIVYETEFSEKNVLLLLLLTQWLAQVLVTIAEPKERAGLMLQPSTGTSAKWHNITVMPITQGSSAACVDTLSSAATKKQYTDVLYTSISPATLVSEQRTRFACKFTVCRFAYSAKVSTDLVLEGLLQLAAGSAQHNSDQQPCADQLSSKGLPGLYLCVHYVSATIGLPKVSLTHRHCKANAKCCSKALSYKVQATAQQRDALAEAEPPRDSRVQVCARDVSKEVD